MTVWEKPTGFTPKIKPFDVFFRRFDVLNKQDSATTSNALVRNDTGQKSGGRGRVFGEASEDFNMPLIYAFVARGTTVLAEHTGHSGNFATVAAEVRRVDSALLPPFCDVYTRVGFFCFPRAVNARAWGHETGPIAAHSSPVAFTRDV